jgi:hypothetical protein
LFFKGGKKRERKRESSLVYWLTLLYLFVSCLYVVTATLSGASGKDVFWTVFPFATQPFIHGSLREKRGLDGFSVCPSSVHSWKTDTSRTVGLPNHLRTTDSLLPSVEFSQRLKSTAKYVEPVTLLLVYLGYYHTSRDF